MKMNHAFAIKLPVRFRSIQFILFVGLISCLTPIEIPVQLIGGQLVVSGQISTLSDQNIIQLGITANTNRLPLAISKAKIILFDDIGGLFVYTGKSGKCILTRAFTIFGIDK